MNRLVYQVLMSLLAVLSLVVEQVYADDVLARVVPQRYQKGIFWKIEKPGVPPSYLLGTIHVGKPEVMNLFERFSSEFKSASMVCTEVDMNFKAMAAELRAMYFSDGRTLKKVIKDQVFYNKLITLAEQRGLPESAISSMKPWAAMYMLSMPRNDGSNMLDMKIYTEAQKQGKKVCGLEEIDKHANAFDAFTMKDQLEMLRLTIENIDLLDGYNDRLIRIYLDTDLKAMVELSLNTPGMKDTRLLRLFFQKLVIDRNRDMLRGMQPQLTKGGGFFAVGALHLTGEAGLLRLVEGLGYTLTRIH